MAEARQIVDGRARRREVGRPALYAAADQRYQNEEPIDIAALAAEHGISRATAYRWVGSSEQLLAEVMRAHNRALFRDCTERFDHLRGTERLWSVLDVFMRRVDESPRFRAVMNRNPATTLAILTSRKYTNQRDMVSLVRGLIEEEQHRNELDSAVDAHTLAYALVRMLEAFLYADIVAGETRDLDRASEVIGYILEGASSRRR